MRAIRITMVLVGAALLIPHGCTRPATADHIGLPGVYSGDEPHYLVLLNSVVCDGDFDLANNYREVHRGGDQAGMRFRGSALDHHTAWVVNGKYVHWISLYELDPKLWGADSDGFPIPKLREGADPSLVSAKETSSHWPGLVLLIAPFVFTLCDTPYLEPAALLCSWLAVVLAMFSFVAIARKFAAPPWVICMALVLTFLGTPIWHYGRALFSEAFSMSCVLGAYALLVARRPAGSAWLTLLAGVLGGMCLLLKATNGVLLAPLGVWLLMEKQWRQAVLFALPMVAALGVTVWINHASFGTYLETPSGWLPGDFFVGAKGLLTDAKHGLPPLAPIVISAAIGWPALVRAQGRVAWAAAASVLALFVLIAFYGPWHGGYCYGPRYLVPEIPLIMLGLLMRGRTKPWWRHVDVAVLGVISIWINFHAAVPYWLAFDAG